MGAGGSNDPDDLIVRAFKAYETDGKIEAEMFRHALMNFGDKFNQAEIDDIFGEFEVDDDGFLESKAVIGLFVAGGVKKRRKKRHQPPPQQKNQQLMKEARKRRRRRRPPSNWILLNIFLFFKPHVEIQIQKCLPSSSSAIVVPQITSFTVSGY